MKKRFLTGLLALTLMLGCNGNVYNAADYGCDYTATELQLTAVSYTPINTRHIHTYDMRIKCYNNTYSKSMVIYRSREYEDSNVKTKKTIVVPNAFGSGELIGRYFDGVQECTIQAGTSYTRTYKNDL